MRDNQAQLKPVDAGLAVDYAKSPLRLLVAARAWNPVRIVKVLTGGSAADAALVVDRGQAPGHGR